VLCQRHWNIAPEFIDAAPDVEKCSAGPTPPLIIGDPRWRLRTGWMSSKAKVPQGKDCCCGDDDRDVGQGCPDVVRLRHRAAMARNDRPCVRAGDLGGASRHGHAEIVADFRRRDEYGLAHIGEMSKRVAEARFAAARASSDI